MKIIPEVLTVFDYYIKWRITYKCNYHCEYCIQSRNDCLRSRNEQPYDVMETANKIANMIRPNTLVELVGGEISTVKEIPEITALFKSKGASLKCLTNLSNDWSFYKDFTEIRASFHPSQCNMQEFESKLIALRQIGVKVGAEVVMSSVSSEENNNKKFEFASWCHENDIPITIDTDRWDEKSRALRANPLEHHAYYYIDGILTDKKAFLDEEGMFNCGGCKCYLGVNSQIIVLDHIDACKNKEHTEFKWYDEPQQCRYGKCGHRKCMSFTTES